MPETLRMVRNYHFWIASAITIFIGVLYYTWRHWPWFWMYFFFEYSRDFAGVPLIVPFLYATSTFGRNGALAIWVLSEVVMLPFLIRWMLNIESFISNIAYSLLPIMVFLIINHQYRWHNKQKALVIEREREHQEYMRQVFKAQEDERRHIAQELHDDTTQSLLVIANQAQVLLSHANGKIEGEMKGQVEGIRDAILQVSDGVRRLSLDLRPSILDELGLVPALYWLAERLMQDGQIDVKLDISGLPKGLGAEKEAIIFRIVQEALTNVRRHSRANRALVNMVLDSERGDLSIVITDNGAGFKPDEVLANAANRGKLGLIGIRERLRLINGTLDIESAPGKGTTLSIRVCVSHIRESEFSLLVKLPRVPRKLWDNIRKILIITNRLIIV